MSVASSETARCARPEHCNGAPCLLWVNSAILTAGGPLPGLPHEQIIVKAAPACPKGAKKRHRKSLVENEGFRSGCVTHRAQAAPLRLGKPWISLDSGSRVSRCANMQAGRCPRPNMFSVFAGNPIENLRRCHRFLRRMGIQGPGNRAPALLDHLLGKLLRLGFRLEFAGRASGPGALHRRA